MSDVVRMFSVHWSTILLSRSHRSVFINMASDLQCQVEKQTTKQFFFLHFGTRQRRNKKRREKQINRYAGNFISHVFIEIVSGV